MDGHEDHRRVQDLFRVDLHMLGHPLLNPGPGLLREHIRLILLARESFVLIVHEPVNRQESAIGLLQLSLMRRPEVRKLREMASQRGLESSLANRWKPKYRPGELPTLRCERLEDVLVTHGNPYLRNHECRALTRRLQLERQIPEGHRAFELLGELCEPGKSHRQHRPSLVLELVLDAFAHLPENEHGSQRAHLAIFDGFL
mmetsp:Transcript_13909/g.33184  ORF Transcript_13909/g.33184 Transcript_13909/m.33184 type:complete len:201 (-) Transcript_13909:715-1317(-)